MGGRILSVGEFATGAEAALARGLLEGEGIDADVAGEMTQAWAYGMGPYTQCVRLEVREEDAPRARALIEEVEGRVRNRLVREDAGASQSLRPGPASESDDLQAAAADARSRRVLVAAVLALGFPIPVAPVALWLFVDALVRRGPPLGAKGRLRVVLAGVILALSAALTWALWATLG